MARLTTDSGLVSLSWWTGLNLRVLSSHQLWLKVTKNSWAAGTLSWLWLQKLALISSIVSAHTNIIIGWFSGANLYSADYTCKIFFQHLLARICSNKYLLFKSSHSVVTKTVFRLQYWTTTTLTHFQLPQRGKNSENHTQAWGSCSVKEKATIVKFRLVFSLPLSHFLI